jgi:hypothetical protein
MKNNCMPFCKKCDKPIPKKKDGVNTYYTFNSIYKPDEVCHECSKQIIYESNQETSNS